MCYGSRRTDEIKGTNAKGGLCYRSIGFKSGLQRVCAFQTEFAGNVWDYGRAGFAIAHHDTTARATVGHDVSLSPPHNKMNTSYRRRFSRSPKRVLQRRQEEEEESSMEKSPFGRDQSATRPRLSPVYKPAREIERAVIRVSWAGGRSSKRKCCCSTRTRSYSNSSSGVAMRQLCL
jgi:hypothetical protein